MGRLQDPVARPPGDQMMGRSGEVRGTSVIHVFKIQLKNIWNLLWQVTQGFIGNCSSENLVNSIVNKKNLNRDETWWVMEDIIKIWLEVCGKVPFLIFWH